MIAGVADTHTAIWYIFNDDRLSLVAGDFIDRAAAGGLPNCNFVHQPRRDCLSHREG